MRIATGKTTIFGRHDEATLKQIQTCVAAGGERGVLCANGHSMGEDALTIEGIVVFTSEAKENLNHPAISQIIVTDSIPVPRDAWARVKTLAAAARRSTAGESIANVLQGAIHGGE